MADEIELKFLDINIEETKQKLLNLGAKLEYDKEIRSVSFKGEHVDPNSSKGNLLRLRQIGDNTILTLKGPERIEEGISIREEHETTVENLKNTKKILKNLGYTVAYDNKKHRQHFTLKDDNNKEIAAFEIDDWGIIPPFLEIEAKSKQIMQEVTKKLGLDIKQGKTGMICEIYPDVFD